MIAVKRLFLFAAAISISAAAIARSLPSAYEGVVEFSPDIEPILKANCYSCHGPKNQKGGLRLDSQKSAMLGGDEGKVIVPGKSAESKLIHLVAGFEEDKLMPPKGDRLSVDQIAKLRRWIDDGAIWPETKEPEPRVISDHWAFQKIVRPQVPPVTAHVDNAIDGFVLRRLDSEGLKASQRADRTTLIRRLSLDLLGLPPTLEEVDRFLADEKSNAYAALVDRLLASEHFGERWGRHWLDLARYADSDGYEKDRARPYAYVFRDWVIKAVNDDIPFDRFSKMQLAGDLFPDAGQFEKLATGFHRQTLTNTEGGTDKEEFRCKNVVDRVSTTSTVWLGVTMGCAECHSHKYDPFSQREFYQLFAFFNDSSEKNIPAPQSQELQKYDAALKVWEGESKKRSAALSADRKKGLPERYAKWVKSTPAPKTSWQVLKPTKLTAKRGSTLKVGKEAVVIASGTNPGTDTYVFEANSGLDSVRGVRLEAIDDPSPKKGPGRSSDGNFVLTRFSVEATLPDGAKKKLTLQNPKADFSQVRFDVKSSILGKTSTGWAVSPKKGESHVAVYEVKDVGKLSKGTKLTFSLEHNYKTTYLLQRFRISITDSAGPFIPTLGGNEGIGQILAKSVEQRTKVDNAQLFAYYRDQVDPQAAKLRKAYDDHNLKKPKYPPTVAATMIAEPKGRKTHVHKRGNFMDKGDEVLPLTPAVLHPLKPRGKKPDRLDLANWLFEEDNPLTARVTVNHVWKNLFGRGLVSTVDDFGTRGDKPSHPELLDWLATEYRRLGWSRKALIKSIVMSATYQQSSQMRPELLKQDPLNMLFARQSRLRLEAEIVRDSYLTASGLLKRKIGGPSIRPPLPSDIAALGYANSVKWAESKGDEKYRRGMYIFFQRSVPYPMLMTFDAPESTATCVRRERSNTPLQALTLLNDPVFFECAQVLGKRMVDDLKGAELTQQIAHGFRLCVSREPTPAELDRLTGLYEMNLKLAKAAPESAAKTIGAKVGDKDVAERSTLVALGRVMLNLDEFITRE